MKISNAKLFKIVSVIIILICAFSKTASGNMEGVTYSVLFSLNLGDKDTEIGGLTENQLAQKEDPFAYAFNAYPQDFAVDYEGNIIIADNNNKMVKEFTTNGKLIHKYSDFEDKDVPCLLEIGTNGDMFVAACSRGAIYVFDKSGKRKLKIETREKILQVDEIDSDSKGNLYIYSLPRGIVYIYNNKGDFTSSFEGQNVIVGPNDVLWSRAATVHPEYVFQYALKGDWDDWHLIAVDKNKIFYSIVRSTDRKDYLILSDENGNVIRRIDAFYGDYYFYDWFISKDGDIYATGINRESKKDFIKIFIVDPGNMKK